MNHDKQPHVSPSSPGGSTASYDFAKCVVKKHRGIYNCGRCGLPKKGHSCHLSPATAPLPSSSTSTTTTTTPTPSEAAPASVSTSRPTPPSSTHRYSSRRRALSFDNIDIQYNSPESELDEWELDLFGSCSLKLPLTCMWEVLRRLPPVGLLVAARVCKGWRETSRRLWRAAEELRLRVPAKVQLGLVGSVLQKCPGLSRLTLRMER